MPARIASAPPSRCSGPVVSNRVRGPSAREQRRAIARRHSVLPDSAAALKFAGSAGSLAGSFGGSSHPKRTAMTGSSEAREASPGSLAVARAALGLGATIALAPRQPSATSECEADSSPSSSGPRISASGGASDGPRRPVGNTNSRTAAEVADSAAAAGSPQPMVTSGAMSLSVASDRTAAASSAAVSARPSGVAASTSNCASPSSPRPSNSVSSCVRAPTAALTVRNRRASPGTRPATSALASVRTVVRWPIAESARLSPAAPSGETPSPRGATASAISRKSRPGIMDLARSGYRYSVAPRSSSSPGNSFTEGYFMISLREIFQAF